MTSSQVISRVLVREQLPVVIHGTVGCDLAAQASSLAQLLIDPYFRTYEGFQKLIEKEWIKNGHPFSSRCGHYGTKGRAAAPQAPVFAMWLDAVWQCTRQYPWEFEFNEAFLLVLAKHSFGSQYVNIDDPTLPHFPSESSRVGT